MKDLPPIGMRVKLNEKAHTRLGATRVRDAKAVGTVVAHDQGRKDLRAIVEWDKPKYKEPIHPVYLEEAK